MKFKQAYLKGKIDRFEMMELAKIFSELNCRQEYVTSPDFVELKDDGHFEILKTTAVKKKDVFYYFSKGMSDILAFTDKRLASIFLNHYLACQNNTAFYKYLPRSHKRPFVMACGGLSGSGKSRVAREIAPELTYPLSAIVIRDDIVRKQMAKVDFDDTLGPEWYTPQKERLVYKEMRRQAKQAVLAGYPVILDALFYNPEERKKAEGLAKRLKVRFEGFWMEAPLAMRARRVQDRVNNPSDIKKEEDLVAQLSEDVGEITWRNIYTSGTREETLSKVRSFLKRYL